MVMCPQSEWVMCYLAKKLNFCFKAKYYVVLLGEFQSWSVVFDTEYIANQKMVQINAFELSFNLQYQPTLYIAWFSCNLQKFVADFRDHSKQSKCVVFCSVRTAALDRFS